MRLVQLHPTTLPTHTPPHTHTLDPSDPPPQHPATSAHLHNKLLAQQRALHPRLPDCCQVLEAALEKLGVCENRQAGRAAALICLRDLQVM